MPPPFAKDPNAVRGRATFATDLRTRLNGALEAPRKAGRIFKAFEVFVAGEDALRDTPESPLREHPG